MKKIVAVAIIISIFMLNAAVFTHAQPSEHDFYEIFDKHGSVMLIFDKNNGAIEYANEAASNFYGYTVEQLESMKMQEINIQTPEDTVKEWEAAADKKEITLYSNIDWPVAKSGR